MGGIPRRSRLTNKFCECGCGERTSRGPYDIPMRFLWGHNARLQTKVAGLTLPADPNPSGLCFCGCGGVTKVASRTRSDRNQVKGKHMQYIRQHQLRTPDEPVVDERGCWVWQGASVPKGRTKGRPVVVSRDGCKDSPYRYFYRRHVGPIPEGHHLHHTCENPMCVNPAHLEPLTPAEHAKRHAAAA